MRSLLGKTILLLLLSSLGKVFAAEVVAPTKAEIEAMYSRAAHELNTGHYAETLKLLDELDQRQPDVAAAQNLRGVALMRMGEFGPAEKILQKARELDPDLWEARFNLAEVPFLAQNWSTARERFTALADSFPSQAEGATGELIQFKIFLTYLLQGKEKNANAISTRLKDSSVSPAFYYTQAAMALQQKDETEVRINFRAAQKAFPERLNRLFLESFYEIGWLTKPEEGPPTTLEVISEATRVTNAQVDFGNAERAFQRGELDRALELLKSVDAIAPNQAVSYNLHGEIFLEQGNLEKAETAFHNALQADPQFQEARLNLARIPFRKGDFAAARKELESLLGAISGDKQQHLQEQVVRYQIFLTLLREGRESAAQKAMEEFKMTDETPALYYAQAAWAFEHGNSTQGNNWIANATNLFSPETNRDFAKPFADLGWTAKKIQSASNTRESEASASTASSPATSRVNGPVESSSSAPVVDASPATSEPTPKERRAKVVAKASPSPVPSVTPEIKSETSGKKTSRTEATQETTKEERPARSNSSETKSASRSKSVSKGRPERREQQAKSTASSKSLPLPSPTVAPEPTATPPPPRQNLGDKVVRLLSYPFRRHEKTSPGTVPSVPAGSPAPTPPPASR